MPCDLILAAFLLTSAPQPHEPIPAEAQWPALQKGLHQLAIQWEILDPRETNYVLANREEFATDINLLRRRYTEFANAPRLAEHSRLPERQTANDLIRLNREYRKKLDDQRTLELDRAHTFTAAIHEADQLYQVWDAIRDARCDFYYVTVRRQALMKLRDLIGEQAYAAADWPPAVPIWRLSPSNP